MTLMMSKVFFVEDYHLSFCDTFSVFLQTKTYKTRSQMRINLRKKLEIIKSQKAEYHHQTLSAQIAAKKIVSMIIQKILT